MQKITFPEFNLDRLKAEARIWAGYYPEIKAIRLYRGKALNTYILFFHLTDTLGFITGERDDDGVETAPPWSDLLKSDTELSKKFYDVCYAEMEVKPEHKDFVSRLKIAFYFGEHGIGLRFLNENFDEIRFKDHFKPKSLLQLFPEETKSKIDALEPLPNMPDQKGQETILGVNITGFVRENGEPLRKIDKQYIEAALYHYREGFNTMAVCNKFGRPERTIKRWFANGKKLLEINKIDIDS